MVKIKTSKAPSLRFFLSHPAHIVACGFGIGLSPFAPGTVGTLFAWISFIPLRQWMGDAELAVFCILAFLIGIIAVQKTGVDLGATDHGSIVWDEIVPFWLVLLLCPPSWIWQASAFLLFRVFDILKPQPARYFDEEVKNGFGVMCDDLVAGAYTVLVLAIARFALS